MVKTEKNPCPDGLIERIGKKKIVKINGLEKCITNIEIYFYDKKKTKISLQINLTISNEKDP